MRTDATGRGSSEWNLRWTEGARLYLLPFDHRGSFKSDVLGLSEGEEPNDAQQTWIKDLKLLIYEGLEEALAMGAPRDWAGVLVDEEFGTEVARRAKLNGLTLAMPVEHSGQDEFDFEYGDDFVRHIEEFDPDFVKVLVRFNPDGDTEMNARQATRLCSLSRWLQQHQRALLFELLVPPTDPQLAQVGGDVVAYEHQLFPELVMRAITSLQDAGVEPNVWKIQGFDDRADCERAVARARAGGRDDVVCIVLGHGADDARVRHWLKVAACVEGYVGFAVGRTVWFDAVAGNVAGHFDRASSRTQIAEKYRAMVNAYELGASERAQAPGGPASSREGHVV